MVGRWVYALKPMQMGLKNSRHVIDYDEMFSPTANLTMQKAAQENLILHQIDVKTAHLHAPIDFDIYMTEPQGYEITSKKGEMLVC